MISVGSVSFPVRCLSTSCLNCSLGREWALCNQVAQSNSFPSERATEFSQDGTFVREIGHNLYAWSFAHAVKIDKDDHIWAADKGSDMAIKFNHHGRRDMV